MSASPYREADVLRLAGNTAVSQTDEVVRAALAGRRIRVLAVALQAGGTATAVTFNTKPAGSGVAISPLFALGANGAAVLPFNAHGWFETAAGQGLTITTGTGTTVGWVMTVATVGAADGSGVEQLLLEDAQGSAFLLEDGSAFLLEAA